MILKSRLRRFIVNKKCNREIISISVISSSICNLNCSFCYLNKNKSYKKFNELTRQAWQNGDYVKNLKNTIQALNINVEDVQTFQLWGGETLLTIEDLIPNLQKIYEILPNLTLWQISTNWMVNIENVFKFFQELDKCGDADKELVVTLQLSIDGPPGPLCEQGHNGNWDTYINNIKQFTNLVNNYKFRHLKIIFSVNSTVNKENYFNEFNTYEKIKSYVQYMKNFTDLIDSLCISKSLEMGQKIIFPGLATPYFETTEDGWKFREICALWENVRIHEFPDFPIDFNWYHGCGEIDILKPILSSNLECSELKNSLTINYDGTIVECSGSYIDHFTEYQQELLDENRMNDYYTAQLHAKVSFNPDGKSIEDINTYNWFVYNGYKSNTSTYLTLMMATCEELALSGQIPSYYAYDKRLLLKQLNALSNLISCTRENIRDTRIPYLVKPECFRRFLNGVMQYAYESQFLDELRKKNICLNER